MPVGDHAKRGGQCEAAAPIGANPWIPMRHRKVNKNKDTSIIEGDTRGASVQGWLRAMLLFYLVGASSSNLGAAISVVAWAIG